MPNCFQLTRKSQLEKGPVAFQIIDKELCEHFKEPCDDKRYYLGWYDYIGLCLALGLDFAKIKSEIGEWKETTPQGIAYKERMLEIAEWMDEHFTPNAWAEFGGRR